MQCRVCVHRPMCCAALKNVKPSPPNPYISETAFSCTFQKVYTYPPPGDDMFAHRSKSCRKCRKVPKPRKLAGSECPREICTRTRACTRTGATGCQPFRGLSGPSLPAHPSVRPHPGLGHTGLHSLVRGLYIGAYLGSTRVFRVTHRQTLMSHVRCCIGGNAVTVCATGPSMTIQIFFPLWGQG